MGCGGSKASPSDAFDRFAKLVAQDTTWKGQIPDSVDEAGNMLALNLTKCKLGAGGGTALALE